MTSTVVLGDHNYHMKQADPKSSIREEIREMRKSFSKEIDTKTTAMVNSLGDISEFYYKLAEDKEKYAGTFDKFVKNKFVDINAVNRDPILSGMQKCFQDH